MVVCNKRKKGDERNMEKQDVRTSFCSLSCPANPSCARPSVMLKSFVRPAHVGVGRGDGIHLDEVRKRGLTAGLSRKGQMAEM